MFGYGDDNQTGWVMMRIPVDSDADDVTKSYMRIRSDRVILDFPCKSSDGNSPSFTWRWHQKCGTVVLGNAKGKFIKVDANGVMCSCTEYSEACPFKVTWL
jgi:hypothetical protein